jgi:very-short-patch-repair endonuclease
VLACGGPGFAAISHVTAAVEWRMLGSWPHRVDVMALGANQSTEAIRVHRSRSLDAQRDLTRRHGLPITTPSRILIDIAAGAPARLLQTACHEAAFRGHLDPDDIALRLETGPPGAANLRRAVERLVKTGPRRTKSQLEQDFLALVDRHDIPPPLVNAPLHGYSVDFLWPENKLVVETDGRNHLRPVVYESDRERDAVLQLRGFRIVRFTSLQIDERPRWVAETTFALLD